MNEPEQRTAEYWAQARPDAPAVIKGDEVLTYGEWNEQADRVAEGLAALGLEPADRVGMRFRLGIGWFVIACNDADASGWAAHDPGPLITVGQPVANPRVRYEDLLATSTPTPRFGARRPNLVLCTSGTTGAPRGVAPLDPTAVDLDHLIRYWTSVASVPPQPKDCVTLLTLPVHHGAGAQAASGACMIVADWVNIYPAEVEKALIQHPGVVDAAVIGIPEPEFGEQPLAFIATSQEPPPSPDDLLAFLDGRLASFKKPRQFVFVDELPVNPTGKVLKTGLRVHIGKAAIVVSEQRSPTRILASRTARSIISQTYLVKGSFSVSQ